MKLHLVIGFALTLAMTHRLNAQQGDTLSDGQFIIFNNNKFCRLDPSGNLQCSDWSEVSISGVNPNGTESSPGTLVVILEDPTKSRTESPQGNGIPLAATGNIICSVKSRALKIKIERQSGNPAKASLLNKKGLFRKKMEFEFGFGSKYRLKAEPNTKGKRILIIKDH